MLPLCSGDWSSSPMMLSSPSICRWRSCSLNTARASIWRTRSRVTLKRVPMSSSVASFMLLSSPQRMRRMPASRSSSPRSTCSRFWRSICSANSSSGVSRSSASMSLTSELLESPIGVSSDMGVAMTSMISPILAGDSPLCSATSSTVGSRCSCLDSLALAATILPYCSWMCTGRRTVRVCCWMPRCTDCLIHQCAYVENLKPLSASNFSTLRSRPCMPSVMRSCMASPRPWYFLTIEMTRR
mmetsp:Transcript_30263/g.77154  ORF Transcript_30263/g.77154 Transcript_30263/m.77154 type:complete len:242 (+) Transcript_30263:483-1208(+)